MMSLLATGWLRVSTRLQKFDQGVLVLLCCYVLVFPVLFRPFVAGVDPIGYYSWLRTAVIDHDFDVTNEFAYFAATVPTFASDFSLRSLRTASGYQHNPWPAGSALLWLPLFTLVHLLSGMARWAGLAVAVDGYALPYQAAAALSSTLYGLAAVLISYRLTRNYFSVFGATLAAVTAWFATPLIFYTFVHPLMSHANDAFAVTLIIYAWWRWERHKTIWRAILVGSAIGLATWVRTQNGLLLAAPMILAGWDLFMALRLRNRRAAWLIVAQGIGITAGFVLLLCPLMVFWRIVYGDWLVNTYAVVSANAMDWRAPHLLAVLFSSNRGLFIWTPVTALALVGLIWLYPIDRRLTLFLIMLFGLQLYIIGSLGIWHGGTAFSQRFFANMIPLYMLGLAALLFRLQRWPRWVVTTCGGMFVLWNLLLIVQYVLQTVPRSGSTDLVALVRNQFLVIPDNLGRVLTILMERQ